MWLYVSSFGVCVCVCVCVRACVRARACACVCLSGQDYVMECAGGRVESRPTFHATSSTFHGIVSTR